MVETTSNKARLFQAASLAALLLCGCEGETVSPVDSDVKPAGYPLGAPTSTQATLFVRGMTEKLGLF